jgi:hypothetical protein
MLPAHHDVAFAARRKDVRIIVNIAGHFSIPSRRGGGGARPVFSCRAVHVSSRTIALTAAVDVKIGDQINAEIDHLGTFDGTVVRILQGGFVISISASDEERDKLDDKIEWLERYKNLDTPDLRAHPRFTPAKRRTKMVFADGTTLYCLIQDVSVSGAAILSDTIPAIDTVLAIGTLVSRVVRHFKGGFGVKFIKQQSDARLNAMVQRD